MDNDYTPFDHGTQTKQEGDKFYKTPEQIEAEWDAMKEDEMTLDDLEALNTANVW